METRVLGLVPARAGSERVADKNIRPLGDKPLIAWTIEAARSARLIDRVIVSTDAEEIAAVARSFGAEVPFLRPAVMAQRDSNVAELVRHALDWLAARGYEPDAVAILFPTSPFRTAATIDRAVRVMQEHPDADSLRSVCLCSEHPHKMWTIQDGWLQPFVPAEDSDTHTLSYQALPTVYVQNASIYITRPRTLRDKGSMTGDLIVPFVMDEEESYDINSPLDLELAELLLRKRGA